MGKQATISVTHTVGFVVSSFIWRMNQAAAATKTNIAASHQYTF